MTIKEQIRRQRISKAMTGKPKSAAHKAAIRATRLRSLEEHAREREQLLDVLMEAAKT